MDRIAEILIPYFSSQLANTSLNGRLFSKVGPEPTAAQPFSGLAHTNVTRAAQRLQAVLRSILKYATSEKLAMNDFRDPFRDAVRSKQY